MNVCQMEEEARVNRYVPIPLDHSPAAVSLDTLCLDIPALVIQLSVSNYRCDLFVGLHMHAFLSIH